MKKVLLSLLSVALLTTVTTVAASEIREYVLRKANYLIEVNGQAFKENALPVLNFEGNTYIPLRYTGDLLGVDVSWNQDERKAQIKEIFQYIEEDEYKDIELELVKLMNETAKAISDKDVDKYQSLFVEQASQKISSVIDRVIVSITNLKFKEIRDDQAWADVTQTFRITTDEFEQQGMYGVTYTSIHFIKENGVWKLGGYNY